MSDILRAPINYGVAAGGQFVKGGSVVFGFENIRPDAANPATLKAIFLDDGLTLQAANPQGLSSDATFDQADNGVLFGDTGAKYSIIIYDANDEELSYIPSYDLSDASASITAQDAANDASASAVAAALSEVAAGLSEANTLVLYTDFVNRYFGAFASDPTLDAEGNPPVDGSLYWNTVNKTFKSYDSGVWYLPQDLGFGTAAYANTGTAPSEIPLNSDLGTASTANVQAAPADATPDAVLLNRAHGLGADMADTVADLNALTLRSSGAYLNTTANSPDGLFGEWEYFPSHALGYGFMTAMSHETGLAYTRFINAAVWSGWVVNHTGANLVEAQNVSGGTVLASGQTAGANLVPAQSGNWSPSTDTLNNAYNLWVKQ